MLIAKGEIAPLAQANEVRPPHAPENNCMMAPVVFRSVPIKDNEIVAAVPAAPGVVNLYHTSSSGLPTAQPTGILPVAVAAQTVPAEGVPAVKMVAPAQLSLAGACENKKFEIKRKNKQDSSCFMILEFYCVWFSGAR